MKKIFEKCPECGAIAFIQPDLCTKDLRVFKCEKGHKFERKTNNENNKLIRKDEKKNDQLDHLPEWANILKFMVKNNSVLISNSNTPKDHRKVSTLLIF